MSQSLTPATEIDYHPETGSGWNFSRSPNVWYPSADPWTTTDGKKEQERLGIAWPAPETPMPEGKTSHQYLCLLADILLRDYVL